MAYAREIFQWIKSSISFQQADKEADSHYTQIGGVLVRISNHCTWMKVWENYFALNPKDKGKPILSLVFEDKGDTYTEDCLFTVKPRKNPIRITEYVYHAPLNKSQVNTIIKSLQMICRGQIFNDELGISEKWDRVSVNPDYANIETTANRRNIPAGGHGMDAPIEESKINKNMKQTKKITESQLRAIVAESVKKVLNENKPYWGNEVYPTPYQSIIDKILPVWKELHSKCDFDDGMELSQEEANVLGAANHLSKAMDLLRYPRDRR